MPVETDLAGRIAHIKSRIADAAQRSGRTPGAVTLVAVSKGADRTTIGEAVRLGLRVFGENRIVTAEDHFVPPPYDLPDSLALHLIGHLQSNKAKRAAQLFSMIHSVDSINLARALDRHRADSGNGRLPILFEVNIGGEASKSGFAPEEVVARVAEYIAWNPAHLRLEGLMTIAPLTTTTEATRPYFRQMATIFHQLQQKWPNPIDANAAWRWQHLSMGMTNDFEVAIEEGATLVRIGRALFG